MLLLLVLVGPGLAWLGGLVELESANCRSMQLQAASSLPQSGLQSPALTLDKLFRANIDWRRRRRRRRREDDGL